MLDHVSQEGGPQTSAMEGSEVIWANFLGVTYSYLASHCSLPIAVGFQFWLDTRGCHHLRELQG